MGFDTKSNYLFIYFSPIYLYMLVVIFSQYKETETKKKKKKLNIIQYNGSRSLCTPLLNASCFVLFFFFWLSVEH